jgi:hypothetical protein
MVIMAMRQQYEDPYIDKEYHIGWRFYKSYSWLSLSSRLRRIWIV